MSLPKVGNTPIEKEGVGIVTTLAARQRQRNGLGFIYRNQPEADAGIDGHIEITNPVTCEYTGKLVGVQIKTGQSFFRKPTKNGWTVHIPRSTVEYWRRYAVPVILTLVNVDEGAAYWTLGSSDNVLSTKKSYRFHVPQSQRLDASSADAIAELAQQAPEDLLTRLRALAAEVTVTTATDLERHRIAWYEGRRADARAWLEVRTNAPEQLQAVDGPVAGAVLRFAASTTLEEGGDVQTVRAWSEEARRRDPTGDDSQLRAALLARTGDLTAAIDVLSASSDPGAQIMRAEILCNIGDTVGATAVLASTTPVTDVDIARVWMVRTRLCFIARDWAGVLDAMAAAEAACPRHAEVRIQRAKVAYYEGVVPAARPHHLDEWPWPISKTLVRGDAEAINSFVTAVKAFQQILALDWTEITRRHIEAWYLAALSAVPAKRDHADGFVRDVLARDPGQPYVLHRAVFDGIVTDSTPHIKALAAELEQTHDLSVAEVYIPLLLGLNLDAGAWLDSWKQRFEERGASHMWSFWRAQAHLAVGETDVARMLLAGLPKDRMRVLETAIMAEDARRTGSTDALARYLERAARDSGDVTLLLTACTEHARAERWDAVAPHVDELLATLPTAFVRRLAIFTCYQTRNFARCAALIDSELALQDATSNPLELRRMRGDVRQRVGNVLGALEDFRVAANLSGDPPALRDILALARALFYTGQTHELEACVREAAKREDLDAANALLLAAAIVHDNRPLAVTLWNAASTRGIPDDRVPAAVALGFQLGLDAELGPLHARMNALALAGAPNVSAITLDELIEQIRNSRKQQQQVLAIYERGEVATQMLAHFLNSPLVDFYHATPGTNGRPSPVGRQFALQFRDGSRAAPGTAATIAGRGRLALDLTALLLAEHLQILDQVEAQFAPVRLSAHVLIALHEQRDRLKPHQPSRLTTRRLLLQAQRDEKVLTWTGSLPSLDADTQAAAGRWTRWVALLERALQENAFVVDLPLRDETPYGRPAAVAGTDRLDCLLTLEDLRRFLVDTGALDPLDSRAKKDSKADIPSWEAVAPTVTRTPADDPPAEAHSVRRRRLPLKGDVVYLTMAGADALSHSGLLDAAATVLSLFVDPADQAQRRADLDDVQDLADSAEWLEGLLRRVSDGLSDGRYEMLSTSEAANASELHGEDVPENEAQMLPHEARQPEDSVVPELQEGPSSDGEIPEAAPECSDPLDSKLEASGDPTLQKGGRPFPLSLRVLADLVSQPPETIDAVWIDDRAINRHQFAGTARLVDVLDVVAALAAAGRIDPQRRWAVHHQLRSANVRIVPLIADEILYHLRAARITDGVIVETPPLRVLRQYAAAVLEDAHMLRMPTPEQLAMGHIEELEVVRVYNTAVRDTLIELWRSARHQPGVAGRAEAEARSHWLMSSLYIDLGILRAQVIRTSRARRPNDDAMSDVALSTEAPDPTISALDAAALLTNVIHLLSTGEQLRNPTDDLAVAYANWVYTAVAADRAARDASFRAALIAQLRHFLLTWVSADEKSRRRRALARRLAGWTFDALPEPLRDVIAEDQMLLRRLGRSVSTSLTVGPWHIALREFAEHASNLSARPSASNSAAELMTIDGEAPVQLTLTFTGPASFTLSSPNGGQTIRVRDAAFGILSPALAERRLACEAVRHEVDLSVDAWRRATKRLVATKDPAARFEALVKYRQQAVGTRFTEMTGRWRKEGRVRTEDLRASPPDAVLNHLRLKGEWPMSVSRVATKGPVEPHVRPHGVDTTEEPLAPFRSAWDCAAKTLINDEGLLVAFDRLSCLPVPMPSAVRRALKARSRVERREFVKHLLSTPTSPVGAVHAVWALILFGETEVAYRRLAWRLMRHATTTEFEASIHLLQLVCAQSVETLRFSSAVVPSPAIAEATERGAIDEAPSFGRRVGVERIGRRMAEYVASWHHAHRFVASLVAGGGAPEGMVDWLKGRASQDISTLFAAAESGLRDIGDPSVLRTSRFIVGALQYACAGTSLVEGAGDLSSILLDLVTTESDNERTPHPDLLRDLDANPDLLGTWLRPMRSIDGSVSFGGQEVVSKMLAPQVLREGALSRLQEDPTDSGPWMTLEIVAGTDPLIGAEQERFNRVTDGIDVSSVLHSLGQVAVTAARRLACQAGGEERVERRDWLRSALVVGSRQLASAPSAGHANSPTAPGRREGGARDQEVLTDWQSAAMEAFYVLAQSEATPVAAMHAFAGDLLTLGQTDVTYLKSVRGVLEQLIADRPLPEAFACLPLLLKARGT
jgi:hypothetical protein